MEGVPDASPFSQISIVNDYRVVPVVWQRITDLSICKNERFMLNQDQIILSGMMMLSEDQCEETLGKAFPDQPECRR